MIKSEVGGSLLDQISGVIFKIKSIISLLITP